MHIVFLSQSIYIYEHFENSRFMLHPSGRNEWHNCFLFFKNSYSSKPYLYSPTDNASETTFPASSIPTFFDMAISCIRRLYALS